MVISFHTSQNHGGLWEYEMNASLLELLPFHAGFVELVACKFGLGQCFVPVVLRQHLRIIIGNFDGVTFEDAVAKWEKISDLEQPHC